jgi:two-component system osmolarity sensor histidine kinase EnvZ
VAVEERQGVPIVWLEFMPPDSRAVRWLAVKGPLFELRNLYFVALTVLVSSTLIVALSWRTARHLTLPLERLRNRIREGRRESAAERNSKRVPEVAEIAQAYDTLLAQVEQQARDRNLMLVGISHDLRSPLGRIRLAADLLPDDRTTTSMRQTIIRNVKLADSLIESFMDVVRAGDLPVDEAVDVSAQARLVAAEFQVDAGALTVVAPARAIQQDSNAYLVRRMLHNLVENAFKHGRPPVTLTVRDMAAQGIWVEVEDAGEGIAVDQREAVLRAFARGDASRSTAGSGLGLTVVQQVLKRVGGSLSLEGQPGRWLVRVKL